MGCCYDYSTASCWLPALQRFLFVYATWQWQSVFAASQIFRLSTVYLAFFIVIIVHASLRLRNLANKVSNKIEAAGLKKTIMGRMFDILGLEIELINIDWISVFFSFEILFQ